MRSDERFRRPRDLELKDFWDRLEHRLRTEVANTPPRKIRYRSVTRVIRMMARPALHGSMAMVMVAVVILSGRPAPANLEVSDQLAVASVSAGPIWVSVTEMADPLPKHSLVVVNNRRPSRFVKLVSNEVQPMAPVPEINSVATI